MSGKNYNYFDSFVRLIDYACNAAKYLHDSLCHFDSDTTDEKVRKMHQIEHGADNEKHDMMTRLAKEFITPIEREDIIQLAQDIDEVTDKIEDVIMRVYMFRMTSVRSDAIEMSKVILDCCNALKSAAVELPNFHKSSSIHDHIVQVNKLEEDGDKLYIQAVHTLFSTSSNSIEMMTWLETYDHLEKCCDACEHVANTMESVVMKNT